MINHLNFEDAIEQINSDFKRYAQSVRTEKWQGMDISKKPEFATMELLNYNFSVDLQHAMLEIYRQHIKPNLPWADDHFLERIGGEPINPGEQWKKWPWGNHATKFLDQHGQFNHNYMERYWPKLAGLYDKDHNKKRIRVDEVHGLHDVLLGIREPFGDLRDVIRLLNNEPFTRQAYMPIFFPEDTGAVHGGRLPCSLGYQFIRRDNFLHINYYLRSCELIRHFRDDCYLTVRLLLWVLDELRKLDFEKWGDVKPGRFSMYITSFHAFINDYNKEFR